MLIDMSQINEGLHAIALSCRGASANAAVRSNILQSHEGQKHVDATRNHFSMPYSGRCQGVMINGLQSLKEVNYHWRLTSSTSLNALYLPT